MEDDIEARLLNVSKIEWLEPLCIEAAHVIKKLKWAVEEGNKGIVEANRLRKALQEIADIEHENIPPPTAPLEANLWGILNGCVTVAEKALGEKK